MCLTFLLIHICQRDPKHPEHCIIRIKGRWVFSRNMFLSLKSGTFSSLIPWKCSHHLEPSIFPAQHLNQESSLNIASLKDGESSLLSYSTNHKFVFATGLHSYQKCQIHVSAIFPSNTSELSSLVCSHALFWPCYYPRICFWVDW